MTRYIARRLGWLVLVLFGLSIVTFTISNVVPADPVRAAAGMLARPEQVENLRRKLGMDRPLPEQYMVYMTNLLKGDMGISIRSRKPVVREIAHRLPATVELTLAAMLLALGMGVPIGVLSALRPNSFLDQLGRLIALVGVSAPVFWLGLMMQWVLYGRLGILPARGRLDLLLASPDRITGMYVLDALLTRNWTALTSCLQHLMMPAVTLAMGSAALFARATRASVLDVLNKLFVWTARGKGLPEWRVIIGHVLKNALLPTLTLVGLQMGSLLSGDFFVEVIFAWPGIGFYGVNAITALDFPVIMGLTVVIATTYVIVNLLVDIGYALLDPRITFEAVRR